MAHLRPYWPCLSPPWSVWLMLVMSQLSAAVLDTKMICGDNVPLCGVLVLISGLAESGIYRQDQPGVHGLWPQLGSYGTSQCIAPKDNTDPSKTYECYVPDGGGLIEFETHEWRKHGQCSGVKDEHDYFTQVCSLAADPLHIMAEVKTNGGNLQTMSDALKSANYSVFSEDTSDEQILLSACASNDGVWKLRPVDQFSAECAGSAPLTVV
eukprot:TRINITY_DN1907_c0_g1_i5.p1 TRINITY_DN1907_c0_g1~~TRINITY_DN1907_c0_g1_i5.p1  ORF type:complete len:210 (-),score=26.65 TRINITY_DN1907_c0_g1_i5:108-737(-)